MMAKLLTVILLSLLLNFTTPALARLDFAQIAHSRGDPVCKGWLTGLDDLKTAEFHIWSQIYSDGKVQKRIPIQRGSRVIVRILGHGADLATGASHSKPHLTVSLGAGGRYLNYPGATIPMGFKDIIVDVKSDAERGRVNIRAEWLTGSEIIPIRVASNCEADTEPESHASEDSFCFGAVGMQCGIPIGPLLNIGGAFCVEGICLVNSGSWLHDECCSKHPGGVFCRGLVDGILNQGDQSCRAEWDRAVSRVQAGFSWHREVESSKVNRDGKVLAADYCAPRGTIIHKNDEVFCCSNKGIQREPTLRERTQSVNNSRVKGYTSSGPARASIPADALVCQ